jgi:threonine/homoserine/homoserine lactone efflux protein
MMLPDYPSLILFLTATVTLNLIPGADVMFVASQSMINKRQGILATFGISAGITIYILATAFGVAGIIQHSPLTFNIIKIVGAGYLFYLAVQIFNKKETILQINPNKKTNSAFYKGIITTLLNPKVGLFFLTFLPQFVDPIKGRVWLQLLSLGVCFVISGTLVNLMYAFLFIQLREKIFSKAHVQKWLDRFTAFVFCAIAFKVITAKQNG